VSTDDPRRIFTPEELEYFDRAPAFDRTVLGRAADRWQELQARHGRPPVAWICLRNGERLAVSKVQLAITYADCELEDGSIRLIDLRAFEQIVIEPRPDDQPEPAHHPPGFWVESDPGAQSGTTPSP
jgi:hypothetical protein